MPIAVDFGTCNTVIARWNPAAQQAETVPVEGLTRRYDMSTGGHASDPAYVIPTLIHYGENNHRLLGEQVAAEGLLDHCGTFRWLKLDLLSGNSRGRWIHDAMVNPFDAAGNFVGTALFYTLGQLADDTHEEIVATFPVESYDAYVQWLREAVSRGAPGRRVRLLDEATASILGYHRTVRNGDIYMIFDFGGGTLDISIVQVNLDTGHEYCKCKILGRAGEEVGGVMIDQWLLEDMMTKEGLRDKDIEAVGTSLIRQVEEAKIALSGGQREYGVEQYNDMTGRVIEHTFAQDDLRSILIKQGLARLITRTIDRTLDAAGGRYATRKSDIKQVLMVGGSSLLLGLHDWVRDIFPDTSVQTGNPFGAIAAGACRYTGEDFDPTLVHNYEVEGWNRDLKEYEYIVVVEKGTQYPTGKAVTGRYVTSACDQQTELGLIVFERSEQVQRDMVFEQGSDGRMKAIEKGKSTKTNRRALNPDNREFIHADPPCDRDETRRFVIGFREARVHCTPLWPVLLG